MKTIYFNSIFHLLKKENRDLTFSLDLYYYDKDISLYTILSLKELSNQIKIKIYLYKYYPNVSELKNIIIKTKDPYLNTLINDPSFFKDKYYYIIYENLISDQELSQKFINIILNDSKPNYLIKL